MDLLGGEVGGGVIAQQEVVIGASVRNRADAQGRAGMRPVAAVDIVQRHALRRAHLAIDHHTGLGDQRGPARKRREQRIVGHRAGNLSAQHRHRHIDHAPRLGPAGGDAALEIGALFGEIAGHAAQPGDPGAAIGVAANLHAARGVIGRIVEAFMRDEGEAPLVEIDPVDSPTDDLAQEGAIGRGHRSLRSGRQRGECSVERAQFRLTRGHAGGGLDRPTLARVRRIRAAGLHREAFRETLVARDQRFEIGRRGRSRRSRRHCQQRHGDR